MKMKKAILLLTTLALSLQSCVNYSNIDVNNVNLSGFELVNTSRADIKFDYMVNNPTGSTFIIQAADGFIKKKGINFAQLSLYKPDTIPPKSIEKGSLVVKVDLLDPISILSMGLNISSWRAEDFEIDARITVKNGAGRKKVIRLKDMPLDNLINRL
jgi:hypothetical protein